MHQKQKIDKTIQETDVLKKNGNYCKLRNMLILNKVLAPSQLICYQATLSFTCANSLLREIMAYHFGGIDSENLSSFMIS